MNGKNASWMPDARWFWFYLTFALYSQLVASYKL